jgi:hypothetical protein
MREDLSHETGGSEVYDPIAFSGLDHKKISSAFFAPPR